MIRLYSAIADPQEPPTRITCNPIIFPGGEPHIQLCEEDVRGKCLWVDARVNNCDEWMKLLVTLDAIRRLRPQKLGLFLPYLPGARQDRVTAPGNPMTCRVYADHLSDFNLDLLVTLDPHSSDAYSEYRANTVEMRCLSIARLLDGLIPHYRGFVCPDKGALTRTFDIVAGLDRRGKEVFHAEKTRDPLTGALSGFHCEPLPFEEGSYLITDDICDGGGTFIGLAKEITRPGRALDLWVSHGIFSKGITELLRYFRHIYTTDSFPLALDHPARWNDRITRIPLWSHAQTIMYRSFR